MGELALRGNESIRLVIADVDGTLLTKKKELTPRAVQAVGKLRRAGIQFTITSGRPPRGMKTVIQELQLTECIAAFDGGLLVRPDLTVLERNILPRNVAQRVIEDIAGHGFDVWLYTDQDWFVHNAQAPHVANEQGNVKFAPVVTESFDPFLDRAIKIVGVSDDYEALARCEKDVQQAGGEHVSAARSQPYYLDVTHPDANKGQVVSTLSRVLKIPATQIATIGDMPNDVLMFRKSGVSIAMGNASAEVQSSARFVTTSNEEEGFASAMERFVLPHIEARAS